MSLELPPEALPVDSTTTDVLQELQIALGVDEHYTEGLALEAAILWYEETVRTGKVLRFLPPADQANWQPYVQSLEIDPGPKDTGAAALGAIRVDGRARRRLVESRELLALATRSGVAQMVRLRAEEAFRRADGWTVEIGHEEGTES
jgi:hypothetical protein